MKQLFICAAILLLSSTLFCQDHDSDKKYMLYIGGGINQQLSFFNTFESDRYEPNKDENLGYQFSVNVLSLINIAFFKLGAGLTYSQNSYSIESIRIFAADIMNNTRSYSIVRHDNKEFLLHLFFQEDKSDCLSYGFGLKYPVANFGSSYEEAFSGSTNEFQVTVLEGDQAKIIGSLNLKLRLIKDREFYLSPSLDILLKKAKIEGRDFHRGLLRVDVEYQF